MAKVTIELNMPEIYNLYKTPEIAGVCESAAQKMTQATGVEYTPDVYIGETRANAAGFKKVSAKDRQKLCPKCGHWHPNCTCKV